MKVVLDDRLRARAQRAAADRRRGGVRRARDRRAAAAAAELQGDRGAQPRAAGGRRRRRAAAHPAPGRAGATRRRADRRRPHRAAVRRGPHPGLDLHHRAAGRASGRKLAWIAGAASSRSSSSAATTRTRGTPPAGRGGGRHADRRLPRRRHDQLARGAAAGRADRADHVDELHERADELQVLDVRERDEWDAGHIPGSVHTPYHDIHGDARGDRPGAAGGGHLQLGPARGWARACCSATARARSCTWSTAASACAAKAGRSPPSYIIGRCAELSGSSRSSRGRARPRTMRACSRLCAAE